MVLERRERRIWIGACCFCVGALALAVFGWRLREVLLHRAEVRRLMSSPCGACHQTESDFRNTDLTRRLDERSNWSQERWSRELRLEAQCGTCHAVPNPSELPQRSWTEAMARMEEIFETRKVAEPPAAEWQEIRHYFYNFSPEIQSRLADDPDPSVSPLLFQAGALGRSMTSGSVEHPMLGHVTVVDLDQDARPDVLACDTGNSAILWISSAEGAWRETVLANVRHPARAQAVDADGDGDLDVVAGCLGALPPTDDLVGSVALLINEGLRFSAVTLVDSISRVADVRPGDFDNDGDMDFVVAAFGFITAGEVGWLERRSEGGYKYHPILSRPGAGNVLPVHLNGDEHLDFVALFAQEHERISAFLNGGRGQFQERILFEAGTPSFGSSGLQLVDLDRDGDTDLLHTNGDNMDLPTVIPRAFHGVRWLENRGELKFVPHEIHRFYGAYSAVAGDLDNDADLDLVVTSLFNDWADPKRASILWLENNGSQQFTPHGIAREPIHLIAAAIDDLDLDGWKDIIASGMHAFSPYERLNRITLWRNGGPANSLGNGTLGD